MVRLGRLRIDPSESRRTERRSLRYPAFVPQRSPTFEGFRAIFRTPPALLAEITWRWAFGATALLLLIFGAFEYFDSLTVTSGELLFFRSRQPVLISHAIEQVLKSSGQRLVLAALIALTAIAIFWMFAAAIGRGATLQGLLAYFNPVWTEKAWNLRSLIGVNFLRISLGFTSLIAFMGMAMVAGFASSRENPKAGLMVLIFVLLASVVVVLWSTLNWYLALAPLFVVRDGKDAFGSIASAVVFARSYSGPVFSCTVIFGLLHMLLFGVASVAALFPAFFATVLPPAISATGITIITLGYFALADLLYVARLASYMAIMDGGEDVSSYAFGKGPDAGSLSAAGTAHLLSGSSETDLDDNILSDVPGLLPPPESAS